MSASLLDQHGILLLQLLFRLFGKKETIVFLIALSDLRSMLILSTLTYIFGSLSPQVESQTGLRGTYHYQGLPTFCWDQQTSIHLPWILRQIPRVMIARSNLVDSTPPLLPFICLTVQIFLNMWRASFMMLYFYVSCKVFHTCALQILHVYFCIISF